MTGDRLPRDIAEEAIGGGDDIDIHICWLAHQSRAHETICAESTGLTLRQRNDARLLTRFEG